VHAAKRLFYTVGVCGYLYSYTETRDNILLNFPLSVKAILIGRIGYGITILFGMPLVFLPCRAAILSLPTQVREWKEAVERSNGDDHLVQTIMKGTKHHIPNGVTFDEECPLLVETNTGKKGRCQHHSPSTEDSDGNPPDGTDSTTDSLDGQSSYETFGVAVSPLHPVDPAIEDEGTRDRRVHFISSVGILVATYTLAVGVPGVGVVWSIAGSSMAIIIGFIIPASCYLKIRSKKSLNPRSIGATLLLIFSIISSVVCTERTIRQEFF
jgi:amino acid permease